jgi:hypothetical protein
LTEGLLLLRACFLHLILMVKHNSYEAVWCVTGTGLTAQQMWSTGPWLSPNGSGGISKAVLCTPGQLKDRVKKPQMIPPLKG